MVNPFRESLRLPRTPEPCAVVVFGASGDLTKRKIMPAIFDLALQKQLPGGFSVIGVARSPLSDDEFGKRIREGADKFARLPFQQADWDAFAHSMYYVHGAYDEPATYARLAAQLVKV